MPNNPQPIDPEDVAEWLEGRASVLETISFDAGFARRWANSLRSGRWRQELQDTRLTLPGPNPQT